MKEKATIGIAITEKQYSKKVSEKDFLEQVIDLAHIFGWRVAHFRPARTEKGWRTAVSADGAGFPDICMVRSSRVVYAELKSEKGKIGDAQIEWLEALQGTGKVEVEIWRPSDFDRITEVLR